MSKHQTWLGTLQYGNESLKVVFELDYNGNAVSGEMQVADPETGQLVDFGPVSGSGSDTYLSLTTLGGMVIDALVVNSQLVGTISFPPEAGNPGLTTQVGLDPHNSISIASVTFAPTTLQWEERVQVTVIVKNDSVIPLVTQGPASGFEYSEGDTFESKGFPSVFGAYRIAVDLDVTPYPYNVHYLYRWGFGHKLAPGESVAVNGYIRFHNSRENGPYHVALIREVNNVVLDHQGATVIKVLEAAIPHRR